jgi:hypothetical protein
LPARRRRARRGSTAAACRDSGCGWIAVSSRSNGLLAAQVPADQRADHQLALHALDSWRISAGLAVSQASARRLSGSLRQAPWGEVAPQDALALELARQLDGDVHVEAAPDRRIDVAGEVGGGDDEAVVLLDPLQQRVDVGVALAVGRLLGIAARAGDRVELVEEQHDRLFLALERVEQLANLHRRLADPLADQPLGTHRQHGEAEPGREVMRQRGLAGAGLALEQRLLARLETGLDQRLLGEDLGQPFGQRHCARRWRGLARPPRRAACTSPNSSSVAFSMIFEDSNNG